MINDNEKKPRDQKATSMDVPIAVDTSGDSPNPSVHIDIDHSLPLVVKPTKKKTPVARFG